MDSLTLNPRYIRSGFKSQAKNIEKSYSKADCKLACLLQVISSHILKYGSDCFASTSTLLEMFNKSCHQYGISPIKEGAIYAQLNKLEQEKLISRVREYVINQAKPRRHISINLEVLSKKFSGVFNTAMFHAKGRVNREKPKFSGDPVDNSCKASSGKRFENISKNKNTSISTKDLSKDRKINKGKPSFGFYFLRFKEDANEARSLQASARKGDISAAGALKLIRLHDRHCVALAASFKAFLLHRVAQGDLKHSGRRSLTSKVGGNLRNSFGGISREEHNSKIFDSTKHLVAKGHGEHRIDVLGQLYYRGYD